MMKKVQPEVVSLRTIFVSLAYRFSREGRMIAQYRRLIKQKRTPIAIINGQEEYFFVLSAPATPGAKWSLSRNTDVGTEQIIRLDYYLSARDQ